MASLSDSTRMSIHSRISSREAVVSVVGLGYVGLPLSAACSSTPATLSASLVWPAEGSSRRDQATHREITP